MLARIVGSLVVGLLLSLPVHAQKARRMTADAVKQKGLTLQKTVDADLDGDGRKELVAVTSGDKGIQLAIVGENAEGAVVTFVAPPALGKELAKVEVQALVPPNGSQQVILEVYDATPDEKVKRVRVYGGDGAAPALKLKEIFSSNIERSRDNTTRPEWETDKSIISYGDPRAGWYFEDLQDDGVTEAIVRRNNGAQIIRIAQKSGEPVKLLTGVRERVWSWDTEKGKYTEGAERLRDFLPAYALTNVEASGAWVEPKELKELKANALSEALMQDAAKEANEAPPPPATAPTKPADKAKGGDKAKGKDADKAKGKDAKTEEDVHIDLSPYVKRAADGSIATAWIENDAKGDGKGEWVEVTLEEEQDIHMVRVVLGCAESRQSFQSHNVPEVLSISLDGGSPKVINRKQRGDFGDGVVAFTDDLVKINDKPWVKTLLAFFDGKTDAKKVRVTLDKAAKQGKGNHTCISEISVH